ncbi:MAG: hypothetical protein DI586_08625 [Micavibrio aeruginosavorus]|uniref:Uncharacterized protein n=1 Tax=Micavibrio aeruginosavorus TaxID=349221 RepID=A0A2W5FIU1_9BACT|nr:MAG: hypothetical protein DI586_08625 [Micavibrio aeruginosavorus]
MLERTHEEILTQIASQIQSYPIGELSPVPGDKWLLSSSMQKAIRRGDLQIATSAAASLWRQDRNTLFRRLITIAPEDVAIGDIEAVIQTFLALTSPEWRRQVGELQVILYLVTALSNACKNRLPEEIYTQIERSPSLVKTKEKMAKANDQTLAKAMKDKRLDLNKRCMASWLLWGTSKYPSDFMPKRSFSRSAESSLLALPVSSIITKACLRALPKTQWPLAGFLPLIIHRMQSETVETIEGSIQPPITVEGVPLYALDTFTRGGQAAFRELRSGVKELQEFTLKQIGLAVFYLEGRTLNKYLTSPFLNEMQKGGEYADIVSSGLCHARYIGLKEVLTEHWPRLQEIRERILKRTLVGGDQW